MHETAKTVTPIGVCCSCIPAGSVGVVQCFGNFHGYVEPGLACFCPPISSIKHVSLAVNQIDCTTECKTKDNVTMTVTTAVQYRINKDMIRQAVFEIVDPRAQIRAYIDDVLRSTLPSMNLDDAYSAKDQVCQTIVHSVKGSMARYGFSIINVLITDLQPDRSVLAAMNEINAARRLRDAASDRGEAEKILKIKGSEADAESKYLAGVGVARMRKAMADGYKESMQSMTETGMSTPDAMHMMVVTQYLDTLKEFANGKSSIMVPHGAGAVMDIESQVRQGFITAQDLAKSS